MKNKPFGKRLSFALNGIVSTFRQERSFRTQLVFAAGAVASLFWLRPEPIWWAVFILTVSSVLGTELVNTALEHVVDRLHPEIHPKIALAKDCAAGAVLVFSLASLGIFFVLLYEKFR